MRFKIMKQILEGLGLLVLKPVEADSMLMVSGETVRRLMMEGYALAAENQNFWVLETYVCFKEKGPEYGLVIRKPFDEDETVDFMCCGNATPQEIQGKDMWALIKKKHPKIFAEASKRVDELNEEV